MGTLQQHLMLMNFQEILLISAQLCKLGKVQPSNQVAKNVNNVMIQSHALVKKNQSLNLDHNPSPEILDSLKTEECYKEIWSKMVQPDINPRV